jgi:hypothetical protein
LKFDDEVMMTLSVLSEREREREREFVSWLLTLFFAGKGHSEEFSGYGNAW